MTGLEVAFEPTRAGSRCFAGLAQFEKMLATIYRRHTAGQDAMIGQGYSIPYRASGTNRTNSAAKPPVKSSPNRDTKSRSNSNHNAKKEAPMGRFNFNLYANAEACFRSQLTAVALSGCIAVAAAVHGPSGTQPYAS